MKEKHQITSCLVQLSIKKTSYNSSKKFLHEFLNVFTNFILSISFVSFPSFSMLKVHHWFASLLHPSASLLFLPTLIVHAAFYLVFFAHLPPQRSSFFGIFISHHEEEIKWNRITEVRVYCTAETGKVIKSIIFFFSFRFLFYFLSRLPIVFYTSLSFCLPSLPQQYFSICKKNQAA